MNILFVCLGNICRSPIAAGVTRNYFRAHSIEGIIESAGTANWNSGRSADHRAVYVAGLNGVDISDHRARQISKQDFKRFELIVAMDSANLRDLKSLAPTSHKSMLLLGGTVDVPDPYYGDESDFHKTYKLIDQFCFQLVGKMIF